MFTVKPFGALAEPVAHEIKTSLQMMIARNLAQLS